ncbi:MAG: hypothetical protein U0T81_09560 [Saprospiraceae bacterium]
MGDVTQDARASNLNAGKTRTNGTLSFEIDEKSSNAGDTYKDFKSRFYSITSLVTSSH